MNAYPSSPPPGPDWFGLADHVDAILSFLGGAAIAAGAAIWRIASWTTGIRAEMEKNREDTTEWRTAMLERLDAMQEAQRERHETTKREMDQIHMGVHADREETRAGRQETREAIASLSARIDGVFARNG